MVAKQTGLSRKRRAAMPLDQSSLEDLALGYLARFATSSTKLENYLHRKIRERGVAEDAGPLDVARVVERMQELRYLDDEAYAQSRAAGLLRRGYGARRVEQDLRAAGIEDDLREDAAPDDTQARRAALAMARKRGFGPFGAALRAEGQIDRNRREKQIAAMIRAGHSFVTAAWLVDATDIDEAEQWAEEAEE